MQKLIDIVYRAVTGSKAEVIYRELKGMGYPDKIEDKEVSDIVAMSKELDNSETERLSSFDKLMRTSSKTSILGSDKFNFIFDNENKSTKACKNCGGGLSSISLASQKAALYCEVCKIAYNPEAI